LVWYIQSPIIFLPSCNIGLLVKGCKLISLRLRWTVGFVLYFAKEKKKKKMLNLVFIPTNLVSYILASIDC
jgi:hypothetical protein